MDYTDYRHYLYFYNIQCIINVNFTNSFKLMFLLCKLRINKFDLNLDKIMVVCMMGWASASHYPNSQRLTHHCSG